MRKEITEMNLGRRLTGALIATFFLIAPATAVWADNHGGGGAPPPPPPGDDQGPPLPGDRERVPGDGGGLALRDEQGVPRVNLGNPGDNNENRQPPSFEGGNLPGLVEPIQG